MSRKLVALVIAFSILLMALIPIGGFAADLVTYRIAQTDLGISLPEGWLYADRSVSDDNPFCQTLGLTAKEFVDKYCSEDDYMIVFEAGTGIYLNLNVSVSDCDDYSMLSDDEIQSLYSWIGFLGDKLVSYGLVRFNKIYFKYVVNDNGISYHYDTVANGKKYEFLFLGGNSVDQGVLEKLYDNIIQRVTFPAQQQSGNVLSGGASDPVLSLFPGIAWGMTSKEMVDKYGSDKVIDMSESGKNGAFSMVEIYDEGVMIIFGFDGISLDSILAIYSEEKAEDYIADLVKSYGDPVRTLSTIAYSGDLKEYDKGDAYAWKTDNFVVFMTFGKAGSVEYRPLN